MRLAPFTLIVSIGFVPALGCSDDSSDGGGDSGGTAGASAGASGTGGSGGGSVSGGSGGGSSGGGPSGGGGGASGGSAGATGGGAGSAGEATGGGAGTPSGPPFGHPDPTADYPTHDGFTLWLVEEFEQPLDLDNDPIWTWSDGALDEGLVRYQKEGISFADGKMILTVSENTIPGSCSHAEHKEVGTENLMSGELRTRLHLFRYGRYEARLKGPSPNSSDPTVNGNYITAFFVFRNPKFQEWREIDIELTGDAIDSLTTNLIYADDTPSWNAGIQTAEAHNVGFNARTDFHDYAFEWTPDGITWFVDGNQIRQYSPGSLPIPELPVKILMNFWIFDGYHFGGSEGANNVYPMSAEYEWVRFYRWDQDTEYPCEAMDETCIGPDDLDMASNNPCDGLDPTGTTPAGPACQGTCE